MHLETKRLIIRTVDLADVDDLLEMQNDEVIIKYNCINKMTKEEMEVEINRLLKDERSLYLQDKKSGKIIGHIYLGNDYLRYGPKSYCISYHLNTNFTGQGFMSEALEEVFKYCFTELNRDVLSARVFVDNVRSNKMLLKMGFKLEGTLAKAVKATSGIIYDDNLYAMFKDDFFKSRERI